MSYDKETLLDCFPHDSYRPGQKEALLEIGETFHEEDKKFAIAELPTGIGKSPIAMAIARAATRKKAFTYNEFNQRVDSLMYDPEQTFAGLLEEEAEKDIFPKAFLVTSQKPLQDQYLHEFGYPELGATKSKTGWLYDIRGKGNYKCSKPKDKYSYSCKDNEKSCPFAGSDSCTYTYERMQAQAHNIASTNSAFYAVGTSRWAKREVTIIDECHNSPDDVLGMVSFSLADSTLNDCGLVDHLYDSSVKYQEGSAREIDVDAFTYWVDSLLRPLEAYIELMKNQTETNDDDEKLLEKLEDVATRMHRYLNTRSHTEWIVEVTCKNANRIFTARPLHSGYFAPSLFFSQSSKVLMQSATITDVGRFAEDMGINSSQYNFIQKPSPFPINNRLVFNMSAVWMNRDKIEGSLDNLCKMIQKILEAYPVKKGIIHCHTYKLQKAIIDRITSDRIITHDSFNREEALKEHITSDKPTILLSPSMTEGLDLKGELARFSIVCKLPFQYLGDRRIKRKCELDPGWGNYQTAKTLVQSVGRGVRSETDWCHTYILDKAFDSFVNRAPLPPDFLNSVLSAGKGHKVLTEAARRYY